MNKNKILRLFKVICFGGFFLFALHQAWLARHNYFSAIMLCLTTSVSLITAIIAINDYVSNSSKIAEPTTRSQIVLLSISTVLFALTMIVLNWIIVLWQNDSAWSVVLMVLVLPSCLCGAILFLLFYFLEGIEVDAVEYDY